MDSAPHTYRMASRSVVRLYGTMIVSTMIVTGLFVMALGVVGAATSRIYRLRANGRPSENHDERRRPFPLEKMYACRETRRHDGNVPT